jgi:hypothetical protein
VQIRHCTVHAEGAFSTVLTRDLVVNVKLSMLLASGGERVVSPYSMVLRAFLQGPATRTFDTRVAANKVWSSRGEGWGYRISKNPPGAERSVQAKGEPSQGSPFFFAAVTPLFAGPAAILSLRRPAKAAYLGPSLA